MIFPASSLYVLVAIVAASDIIPSIGAALLTTQELNANVEANVVVQGYNAAGDSVFKNFVGAYNKGQFFFMWNLFNVYEKPFAETVKGAMLYWCSDLSFTDFQNNSSTSPGYAGRCVQMWLGDIKADLLASGALIIG